jgi:alpha-tubulin suppressor-like RCC1 family protein
MCNLDTPACLEGRCLACRPGLSRCEGAADARQVCGPTGTWAPAQACPRGTVCAEGACIVQRAVLAAAAGHSHTCALLADGRVKCWGGNQDGQLGVGDDRARGGGPADLDVGLPTVALPAGVAPQAIAAGGDHTCVVLRWGGVRCWGRNDRGQLGQGHTLALGTRPDDLQGLTDIDLGVGARVRTVAVGSAHTCALLETGNVKCWGANDRGQLGLGDRLDRGCGPGEMGVLLSAVDLGSEIAVALAAGAAHSCALLASGRIKCWGANAAGQLGNGTVIDRGVGFGEMGEGLPAAAVAASGEAGVSIALAAGGDRSCAVRNDGAVVCWGAEAGGPVPALVHHQPAMRANAVTSGASHGCAMLEDLSVRCWGSNQFGQAGGGGERAVDLGQSFGLAAASVKVSAGGEHTCAILAGGDIKCWGRNHRGQLGLGDQRDRGVDASEMGDALVSVDLGVGAPSP